MDTRLRKGPPPAALLMMADYPGTTTAFLLSPAWRARVPLPLPCGASQEKRARTHTVIIHHHHRQSEAGFVICRSSGVGGAIAPGRRGDDDKKAAVAVFFRSSGRAWQRWVWQRAQFEEEKRRERERERGLNTRDNKRCAADERSRNGALFVSLWTPK